MNWEVVARRWLSNLSTGKVPIDKIRLALLILLAITVAYLLAALTLRLLPSSHSKGQWQPPKANQEEANQRDISALQDLKLFGDALAPAAVQKKAVDAPKTKLRVKLTGVVSSSVPQRGSAIIESKGSQATYGVDDRIDGTRAVIKEIYPDRVIISNAGVSETLQLDDAYAKTTFSRNENKTTTRKSAKPTGNPKLKEALESVRSSTSTQDKIAKLTDYVKITPVRDGTQLKGFRINPGVDQALFKAVGLQANDLAVALNGYDLTDLSQSAQVMEELNTMTDLSLTVERDGQLYDFLLELPSP
ncbi:type II secretion system protein GspC [Neiella marina]|uniref:Type II secretion system protein GspC n=1 Tax=Neiella holothuriorum TaxID=2870530 RepID=A0ABS7EGA5_9GAMM|nr:type II secretion system protein GspC [Neiella holothuriorum]MBW8191255.1 type II secretion system protein GspC [Neiella holothuriorum]